MKKILYFLKIEGRLLKKSIIIIALILTVFLSAFIGVLSLRMDFVNGFYSLLDADFTSYLVETNSYEIDEMLSVSPNELYAYTEFTLTNGDITYVNEDGQSLQATDLHENTNVYTNFGVVIILNNKTTSKLNSASDAIISGQWNNGVNQICIDKSIADALNLAVGDTFTIEHHELFTQRSYVISGIFDRQLFPSDHFFKYYFYITNDHEYEPYWPTILMFYYDVRSAHDCYNRFSKANMSTQVVGIGQVSSWVTSYFSYITPIKLTLDSVALLFLAVMIVILYTLMTLFYRQRKPFICQLKLLGADNGTIFGIYLGIAVAIFIVVTVISSGLGLLFNSYFMSLCETIFELSFRTTFSVFVPLISFAVLALITALLFAISGRRIRSDVIAQEIKAE